MTSPGGLPGDAGRVREGRAMSSSLRSAAHDESHGRISERVEHDVATFAQDVMAEEGEASDDPAPPPIGRPGPPGRPMAGRVLPGLDRTHSGGGRGGRAG